MNFQSSPPAFLTGRIPRRVRFKIEPSRIVHQTLLLRNALHVDSLTCRCYCCARRNVSLRFAPVHHALVLQPKSCVHACLLAKLELRTRLLCTLTIKETRGRTLQGYPERVDVRATLTIKNKRVVSAKPWSRKRLPGVTTKTHLSLIASKRHVFYLIAIVAEQLLTAFPPLCSCI